MIITEEHVEAFGKNLKDMMYSRHISQAQMSSELKIPKTTISGWVNGNRIPRAAAMETLCRYLNCTKDDLFRLPGETDGSSPTEELTAEMAGEVFGRKGVQEPAGEPVDTDLRMVLAALDQAKHGHLKGLVTAAWGANKGSVDFVEGLLKRD